MCKKIAKALGVTETGLKLLARANVQPDGRASGAGFGHGSGGARTALERLGYVYPRNFSKEQTAPGQDPYTAYITDAGREIVRRARAMGW